MATNVPTSYLPSECFLPPESDDEESFVVLSGSLPEDSLVSYTNEEINQEIETAAIEKSLKLTENSLTLLNNSMQSSSMVLPSMPIVSQQDLIIPMKTVSITTNPSVDLSPDEVQQKVDKLIEENMKLKETLHQNNLAMKKQYETLVLWQDDVMKVHQSHKEKFSETKKYIENLKLENLKLTEKIKYLQLSEDILKDKLKNFQNYNEDAKDITDYSMLKKSIDNSKELELNITQKRIVELENQLALEKESHSCTVNTLQASIDKSRSDYIINLKKMEQQFEDIQKLLVDEITILKAQLKDKTSDSVSSESFEHVKEQLRAAQMHITVLEQSRNQDQEIINVKEETIKRLENDMLKIQESIDIIAPLKAQLELYKSDFEAEQQTKNKLQSEKNQIADDLQNLHRRNEQLLQQVEQLQAGDFVQVTREGCSNTNPTAPQDSPPPVTHRCPICMCRFRSLRYLEEHVDYCALSMD